MCVCAPSQEPVVRSRSGRARATPILTRQRRVRYGRSRGHQKARKRGVCVGHTRHLATRRRREACLPNDRRGFASLNPAPGDKVLPRAHHPSTRPTHVGHSDRSRSRAPLPPSRTAARRRRTSLVVGVRSPIRPSRRPAAPSQSHHLAESRRASSRISPVPTGPGERPLRPPKRSGGPRTSHLRVTFGSSRAERVLNTIPRLATRKKPGVANRGRGSHSRGTVANLRSSRRVTKLTTELAITRRVHELAARSSLSPADAVACE